MARRSPQPTFLLPLGVVVLVVLAWLPLLADGLRGEDFPGHAAMLRVLAELRATDGWLPLWNAREYAGASLVPAYLHPIGSLAALTPFAAAFGAERGLEAGALFFLGLAALAMYGWCLHWGRSAVGAALGALVYVVHPSVFAFVGDAGQMHQPVTLAVLPLVFLAWTRLAQAPSLDRALAASLASAALLLDMERFFVAMPFVLLVFGTTAARREGAPNVSRRLVAPAVAVVGVALGTLLLLCFPLLPMLEERSLLALHGPAVIATWRDKLSFVHLLELVDRDGWLRVWLAPLPSARAVTPSGQWYQGLAALAIVLGGAVLTRRAHGARERRVRLALILFCWAVSVALAFGPHTILSGHLQLGREAWSAGAGGLLALCLGMLAIWAAAFLGARDALVERWPDRRWRIDLAVAGAVLLLLAASPFAFLARAVAFYDQMRAPAHFAFPMLPFLLGSAVCLVAPAWQRALGSAPRIAVALAAAVLLHAVDVAPYLARAAPEHPASAAATLRHAFRSLAGRPAGRVLDVSGYSPLADRLIVEEAQRTNAWGWLAWTSTRHTAELLRAGFARSFSQGDFETAASLAGAANVRFLTALAYRRVRIPEAQAWSPLVSNALVTVVENRRVLPYAQLYRELAWLSGPLHQTLPRLARLTQAGIAAYTLDPDAPDLPPQALPDYASGAQARRAAPWAARVPAVSTRSASGSAAPCTHSRPRASQIRLSCSIEEPGYLVIAESWSPRWRVVVDGAPQALLRLNHAFQGVAVERGRHRIVFSYTPSLLARVSPYVSGFAALAIASYGLRALLRRVVRPRGPGE